MRFVKTCVSTKVVDGVFALSHTVVCYTVVCYVKSALALDRLGISRPASITIVVYGVEFVTNPTRRVAKDLCGLRALRGEPVETRGRRFSTEKSLTPKRRCSGNPFRVHPHSVRGAPRLYGLGVPP